MRSTYKYILFDWDGCLAKTLDVWLEIYKELVTDRGIVIENDLDFVEKSFGKWEKGFANVGVKDTIETYKQALAMAEDRIPKVDLYPNAKELLHKLKQSNIKLSLVTSSFRHLVIPALEKHNLKGYFEIILTKNETVHGKPDPWVVNTTLEHMNGKKEETLIIGDSDHDILTGHNAGITSVLYFPDHNRTFYREEFLLKHKPDHIINDLIDLLDIINT